MCTESKKHGPEARKATFHSIILYNYVILMCVLFVYADDKL